MDNLLINIVRNAGDILKSSHCENNDVDIKPGDANFVTKFDFYIQNHLEKELLKIYPNAEFIGEEGYVGDTMKSNISIIVDPIDGTTNFIKDYKHSCISVAIMKNRLPLKAIVYNPYLDDLFYAEKDFGAYLNGNRIYVSNTPVTNGLITFGTSPYYADLTDITFDTAKAIFRSAADLRRSGSAALDMCYVACGRIDLYFEYKISPWDFAAASLIVKEAGGRITTCEGKELNYDTPNSVVAAGQNAHKEFFEILGKVKG